jgi:E3 ubiquitin-protein ligase MYCBP2
VLLQNGEVFTFGSNIYGQLGVGNLIAQAGPVLVKVPGVAVQVAAGSNHTAVLTAEGEVYAFGAHQKGWLLDHLSHPCAADLHFFSAFSLPLPFKR